MAIPLCVSWSLPIRKISVILARDFPHTPFFKTSSFKGPVSKKPHIEALGVRAPTQDFCEDTIQLLKPPGLRLVLEGFLLSEECSLAESASSHCLRPLNWYIPFK